jgi:hypothetical protein
MRFFNILTGTTVLMALCLQPVLAQSAANASASKEGQSAAELAKKIQNPVADLISLPIQMNMNFDAGPDNDLQLVTNVQPVVPFSLNKKWNVITRTIVPLISQPAGGGQDRENGLGDIQLSAFLSPKAAKDGLVWGAGAIAQLDTATDDRLGQGAWGVGPTVVVLKLKSGSPWVYGALANNVWSVAEDSGRSKVNQFLLQPFVNYNFASSPGRYLTFAPIVTADWEAKSGNQWLVPLGLGIGQVTRLGKQPVNLQASFYANVVRPDNAPGWQVRLQFQFMYPK